LSDKLPTPSEAEFAQLFRELGGEGLAEKLGISIRAVFKRRRNIEKKTGATINVPLHLNAYSRTPLLRKEYAHRMQVDVREGHVIVGSDFHYPPGEPTVMHRAMVHFIKELQPKTVIANGDIIDGASISKHSVIGWESRPTLIQEIEVAQDRLHEIRSACPMGCRTIWNLGNHDARFETRIASVAPEYAKLKGVHLNDHFSLWESAWSTFINDSVVVKHRFKGGIHATHANTVWSGRTMITGHLHSAKVTPFTDYDGTRFGVDTGCVAETDAKAFVNYTEDNPKSWVSAFCILTFKGGELLWPELVVKWDDEHVQFRGNIIKV
jgi:hypothetical protein